MKIEDILKQHSEAVEKQFGALSADVQTALEEAKVARAISVDLEQQLARRPGGGGSLVGGGAGTSWGAQFVASDELKSFASNTTRPGRLRVEIEHKATTITSAGGLGGTSLDTVAAMPQRPLHVRDLLPQIPTSSGSVEFPKQTSRTNAAAPVAEAALKPQSDYGFVMESEAVKTVAHWVLATRQILDDAPMLAATIDSELRYGLSLAEDDEILNGNGTGEHLDGLLKNATPYAAPFDPAGTETMLDQLALAMLQVTLADFVPTGVVLHPSDWMRARLLKNADGEYLLGPPGAAVQPLLFGLPVVATPSIAVDAFLVGAFPQAATLYDRMRPRVEASTEDSDNFRRNLVTLLAEERLALAVRNGAAMVKGDLGNVALAARKAK